jgi:hypothetical protein
MAHIGKTGIDLNVGALFFSWGFLFFNRIRLFSLRHDPLLLTSYTECGFRYFASRGWGGLKARTTHDGCILLWDFICFGCGYGEASEMGLR